MDYRKLYTMLFNGITDAVKLLDDGDADAAKAVLIAVQQNAEDAYIDMEE